jgi:small GTP-binding protein
MSSFQANELKANLGEVVPLDDRVAKDRVNLRDTNMGKAAADEAHTKPKPSGGLIDIMNDNRAKLKPLPVPAATAASSSSSSSLSSSSSSSSSGGAAPIKIDKIIKVLVVGNAKCGKSSIIDRYTTHTFDSEYKTTIGADFVRKDVLVADPDGDDNDGEDSIPPIGIRMQLWDIAGQDRFQKLTRAYFNKAKAVVIVCDVSRGNTVDAVQGWKKEIDTWAANSGNPGMPVVLFANKSDLLADATSAFKTGATMERMCRDMDFLGWWITSAKTGESLDEGFYAMLQAAVRTDRAAAAAAAAASGGAERGHGVGTGAANYSGGAEGDGGFKLTAAKSRAGVAGGYDPYASNVTDCC